MTNLQHNQPTIDQLAAALEEAKADMTKAKKQVDNIELQIVELLGHRDEGVEHHEGDHFTLSTTGVINRKLDKKQIWRMKEKLPESVFNSIVTIDPKLNIKGLKSLATLDPESYRVACEFITSTPGKTKVSLKAANDD